MMKISNELESILQKGMEDFENFGFEVGPLDEWLDKLHLNPVMFHGSPNSYAKKSMEIPCWRLESYLSSRHKTQYHSCIRAFT